jgi:protein gp37
MAQNSGIEWTHHTGNLWWGCTKVHAGCDNCYAETLAKRTGSDIWGNDKPRKAGKSIWNDFFKWQALASDAGEVHRCFVGSMMDIFEKPMPLIDWKGNEVSGNTGQLRDRFFNDVVPACPNIMFLLLTKRPSNINKMIPQSWKLSPPANVMFGTSPVDQSTLDNLVYHLHRVNGKTFLSIEPQLARIFDPTVIKGIHWVIQGGESGPNRRPFNLEWAYSMRDFCLDYGIPYFFKQIDKVLPIPADLQIRQFPEMQNVSPATLFA